MALFEMWQYGWLLTYPIWLLLLLWYFLALGIYRLYFSLLANFPGPQLAAVTLWYEFYYDVIKTGTYMAEIKKMHEKYGEFSSPQNYMY